MRQINNSGCRALVFLIMFCFASHSFAHQPTQQSNLIIYRDQQFPFTVYYPKTWIRVDPTNPTTRFKAESSDNGDVVADFNVVVSYNQKLESMSPSEFVESSSKNSQSLMQAMRRVFPDARLINEGKTYISNRQAYYRLTEATYRYLDTEMPMSILQINALFEGNTYTLTFRCPPERYEEFLPTFETIAATFTIRPTEKTIHQNRNQGRRP